VSSEEYLIDSIAEQANKRPYSDSYMGVKQFWGDDFISKMMAPLASSDVRLVPHGDFHASRSPLELLWQPACVPATSKLPASNSQHVGRRASRFMRGVPSVQVAILRVAL